MPSEMKPLPKLSDDFNKWYRLHYPEICRCGTKITEHNNFINDIAVCEKCMHEATKDIVLD